MTEQLIQNTLRTALDYLKVIYDEKQIFGVSVFGPVNYGYAQTIEDIKIQCFYIPTLEEMMTDDYSASKVLKYNNINIWVKDLRGAYNAVMNQDIFMLEALYTEYFIVNPHYAYIFKAFFQNVADSISEASAQNRLASAARAGKEAFEQKRFKDTMYWYYFCQKYSKNLDFRASWVLTSEELEIINSESFGLDVIKANDYFSDIESNATPPEKPSDQLKVALVSIYKASLSYHNTSFAFVRELSDTEKVLVRKLVSMIGEEGTLTITKISKETGISKTAVGTLLDKMRQSKVAVVNNLGSRGTYIKFIDSIVFDI